MRSVTVAVTSEGDLRFVYADELRPLLTQGQAAIRRASRVEPDGIEWTADLTMVGGPVLGPFPTRERALCEETKWLHRHYL